MIVDVGVFLLKLSGRLRKNPYDVAFSRSDTNVPCNHIVGKGNLIFRFPDQIQNFLRALPQNHSFLCQNHLPGAPGAADQKLFPQLLLQRLQLRGKGGLGQMQGFRRGGDALFSGHRQKIL